MIANPKVISGAKLLGLGSLGLFSLSGLFIGSFLALMLWLPSEWAVQVSKAVLPGIPVANLDVFRIFYADAYQVIVPIILGFSALSMGLTVYFGKKLDANPKSVFKVMLAVVFLSLMVFAGLTPATMAISATQTAEYNQFNNQPCTYYVFTDGTNYYAQDCSTGVIAYGGPTNAGGGATGTNATTVVRTTIDSGLTSSGRIQFSAGTFTFTGGHQGAGHASIVINNANPAQNYQISLVGAGENVTTFTIANTQDGLNVIEIVNTGTVAAKTPYGISIQDLTINGNAANQATPASDRDGNCIYAENVRALHISNVETMNCRYNGLALNGISDSVIQASTHNNYDNGLLVTATAPHVVNSSTFDVISYKNGNSAESSDQVYAGCVFVLTYSSTIDCRSHNNGVSASNAGLALYLDRAQRNVINFESTSDYRDGVELWGNVQGNQITGSIKSLVSANGIGLRDETATSSSPNQNNTINIDFTNIKTYTMYLGTGSSAFQYNTLSGNWYSGGGAGMIYLGNFAYNNIFTNFFAIAGTADPWFVKVQNTGSGAGEKGNAFYDGQISGLTQTVFQGALSSTDRIINVVGWNPKGIISSAFGTNGAAKNINDTGSGSATPVNSTTYTVIESPKLIIFSQTATDTAGELTTIKIDGTAVPSINGVALSSGFTFAVVLQPGETYYATWHTGDASWLVSGE